MMQTVTVHLGERSYLIHLGKGLIPRSGELVKESGCGGKVGVVTNPTVAELYLPPVQESLERSGFEVISILVPDGEEYKDVNTLCAVHDRLIEEKFDRGSTLLALGGGVIGDLVGFAAATFLRGISYVQIPTTLLAQVDASVGGKTGVNHRKGKNLIGAFNQPRLVVIDLGVLRTLPRREYLAGLAEVIKYGVIKDPTLFAFLEEKMKRLLDHDGDILQKAVSSSCAIKARVVEKDEKEDDYRSVLNFGHTIAHALETHTSYKDLLHGEAVGVGMALAASLSRAENLCDDPTLKRIHRLIQRAGLATELPPGIKIEQLVEKMEMDKKSMVGKIKFVLCAGLGKTRFQWLSAAEIVSKLNLARNGMD